MKRKGTEPTRTETEKKRTEPNETERKWKGYERSRQGKDMVSAGKKRNRNGGTRVDMKRNGFEGNELKWRGVEKA